MTPITLTNDLLGRFQGGQFESLNVKNGTRLRGQIKTACIENHELILHLDWKARATGHPLHEVKWMFDSDILHGATLTSYTIFNIEPGSKGGERICLMSPEFGIVMVLHPADGELLEREAVQEKPTKPRP